MTNQECRDYWKASAVADIVPRIARYQSGKAGWICWSPLQPDMMHDGVGGTPEHAFKEWVWWQNRAVLIHGHK